MSRTDLYALMESRPGNDPAWNLLDAFDAVTNGMENPEAMKKAEKLFNPELEPWKCLVKAIAFLYRGEADQCRKAAEAMAGDSPPGKLKPLFRAWLTRRNGGNGTNQALFEILTGCCNPVVELYRRLIIEPHPLCLTSEQAEEALRQGMEEQFSGLAGRILLALKEQSPFLALRYAVYCLNLVNDSGYEGSGFFPLTRKCLGEADGFCALALALAGRDNGAAAAALGNALKNAFPRGNREKAFVDETNAGALEGLAKLLGSSGGRRRGRRKSEGLQPDLFPVVFPEEEEEPGTSREKISAAVRAYLCEKDAAVLERILRIPLSFEELAQELPPAVRYLGPGAWIKAIKDASGPV
jgi:hypothetical protein